jgi:cell division protein FtsQ
VSAATLALRRVSPRRLAGEALRRMSPQFKRRLLALTAACIVLTALYQLWFRDSSLVVVDKVQVTGLTTSDSARVRAALTSAGKTMTTLHVDHGALERAVEAYPVVRTIEVQPDFPHGLSIHVIEYRPAAIAISGSTRLPVAGDGTVLRGIRLDGRLPRIDVSGSIGPKALLDPVALGAAAVAGTAPGVLRSRIDHIERTSSGYVATLRDGPDLIFGPARRLRAKWAAAARVLADTDARGATYVDLRLPGRPAVGGLAAETVTPVAPAGEIGLTSTTPTPTTDGTATTPTDSSTAGTDPAQAAPDATQPLDQTPTAPTTGTPVTPPSTTSQGGAAVAP